MSQIQIRCEYATEQSIWLDLNDYGYFAQLEKACKKFASESPEEADDFVISGFCGWEVDQDSLASYSTDLESLFDIHEAIEKHGGEFVAAFNLSQDYDEAIEKMEHLLGVFDTLKDYAIWHYEQRMTIPDGFLSYTDWEALARNGFCGDFEEVYHKGQYYIFENY